VEPFCKIKIILGVPEVSGFKQGDKRRRLFPLLVLLVVATIFLGQYLEGWEIERPLDQSALPVPNPTTLEVEKVIIDHDQDGDGVFDLDDIVQGARDYVETRPRYQDGYYDGGYPPPGEGVCIDVIWQALAGAGYDLKALVDEDIANNTQDYPRVEGQPEPNIDFRRVKNLTVFFSKYADGLTVEVVPGDAENLREWQGGDIVVFAEPLSHIAIVSDQRRADGVPLILHNGGPHAKEEDRLLSWPTPISHHFRFPGGEFLGG
jgi:uncharacterized protein YijF (DUF1287 family)